MSGAVFHRVGECSHGCSRSGSHEYRTCRPQHVVIRVSPYKMVAGRETVDTDYSPDGVVAHLQKQSRHTPKPGADHTDRLSNRVADRLVSDDPGHYRVILERNLFGIGGTPEAIEHAVLTRVISVDDQPPEATFTVRTTDERITLTKGESLQIGSLRAKVVDIEDADVIIESDGQRWLLTIGDRLTDAFALPPEF